jgi:hypothetical protein
MATCNAVRTCSLDLWKPAVKGCAPLGGYGGADQVWEESNIV